MGNSRLQYSSYYEYEAAEDVEDDGDDYQPPSTPKRKKAVAPKSKAPKTPKNPSPKKAKAVTKLDDKPFPLFDLPGELIDDILASPSLNLRDHLSLAASCRTLRSAYYTPSSRKKTNGTSDPWVVLGQNRAFVGLGWSDSPGKRARPSANDERLLTHLWSREDRVKPEEVKVGRTSDAWDDAIEAVNTQRITKTTAKTKYKLSDAQLGKLSYSEKRNPHSRYAAPMQLYVEAAVQSLAFAVHGGAVGHEEHLKKLAATAAKKADNARKRALDNPYPSTPSKKSRTAYYDSDDGADYGYEDDYRYKDDPDFPSFGWYGSTSARAAPSGVPRF